MISMSVQPTPTNAARTLNARTCTGRFHVNANPGLREMGGLVQTKTNVRRKDTLATLKPSALILPDRTSVNVNEVFPAMAGGATTSTSAKQENSRATGTPPASTRRDRILVIAKSASQGTEHCVTMSTSAKEDTIAMPTPPVETQPGRSVASVTPVIREMAFFV